MLAWQDIQPWRQHAACKGVDPEVFFAEGGDYATQGRARRICAACPVLTPCREWALSVPGLHGYVGGTSFKTRVRVRNERLKAETDGMGRVDQESDAPAELASVTPLRVEPRSASLRMGRPWETVWSAG